MKAFAYIAWFASAAALTLAQDGRKNPATTPPVAGAPASAAEVKVPERTPTQKYNRLVHNDAVHITAGIAYAKSRGATIDEYATYSGDQYASGWNIQAGFPGLATGMLSFHDLCRGDDDPAIEILARSDSMLRFKAFVRQLRSFRNGSVYGITKDEFLRWWEFACKRVAARYDSAYAQEAVEGDFLIVTLTKGESAPKSVVGYAQPGRKSSSSVVTAPAAAALSAADIAAIRAASAQSSEFGNKKDWRSWSQTYDEDAVIMPPNGPAVSGRAEIEQWIPTFPPHREFRLEPIEVEGRGDLAMVRGRYSFILMLPGQPEQVDSGKYMEIWRRQPDGAWKIWRDILNSDLPPAPAIATSAQDPWLGTWELNVAKTRINPGPAPLSETRTYTATADGEKATYDLVESDGKRRYEESVYKLDRQHVPLVGNPHGETQALWRTGPRSLAGEIKRDGKVLHTARREVSEDGKTLTVEFKGTNRGGQPIIEEVWQFDRKSTGTAAQDVVAAVKAAAEKHMAAINGGDTETIRNQHTFDFTIIPAEADARLTFPAVLSPVAMTMAKRWEGSKPNWTIRELHIQPYGSVAVATFYQDGKIQWADGTVDSRPRRVTEVWVNENGTWKEAHHHDSVYTTPEKTGAAQ